MNQKEIAMCELEMDGKKSLSWRINLGNVDNSSEVRSKNGYGKLNYFGLK